MHHDTMKEKQKTKKILHSRIRKGVDSFKGIYKNPGREAVPPAGKEQIYNGKVILKNYGHIVYLPHCKSETREKLQCGFQKDREYLALTISIEIKDENVTIYLQGSGRNENNTAEQNNNYNKLKNIFETKQEISKWGWYNFIKTNFKSEVYTNNEEYIKKVKDSLYDKLAEPIAEFNKIISLFENMK